MNLLTGGEWDDSLRVLLDPVEGLLAQTWIGGYKPVADGKLGRGKYELPNHNAEVWARNRAGDLITDVANTTHGEVVSFVRSLLGDTFSNPDVTMQEVEDGLLARFDDMSDYRASLIADTESAFAAGNGAVSGARDAGLEYALISDGTDSDQECADADGQTWTVDDYEANILEHPGCGRSADFLSADEVDPADVEEF